MALTGNGRERPSSNYVPDLTAVALCVLDATSFMKSENGTRISRTTTDLNCLGAVPVRSLRRAGPCTLNRGCLVTVRRGGFGVGDYAPTGTQLAA
jgi:hypothetical protein